jgi:hypothetical protein
MSIYDHGFNASDAGLSRRDVLRRCGVGLGALALGMLPGDAIASPLSARGPQFKARAKRVIHIFCNGGLSHVDSFDPKPELTRLDGKPLPMEYLKTERKTGAAFASPFEFKKHGQSGLDVSSMFPRLATQADELCVVRSMVAEVPNHEPSLMLMNCGDAQMSRPSMGAWITYGLGSENENLPGFVVMCPGGYPIKDAENWQSGFLPGIFQGTYVDSQHTDVRKLIENVRNDRVGPSSQRKQLDLLRRLNEAHRAARPGDGRLDARIESFELAYRMQMEATDAFDVSNEPPHIREMYGDGVHARQTLIARRLLERGVRMVQLWHGAGQPWDNHSNLAADHAKLARNIDQPIAALLVDLKQRGMLDDTLVILGGEFGRTPTVELSSSGSPTKGRDHNPYGFSVMLAGGGVRGGYAHGATDEFGFKAVEKRVHVHDLHATILHLLGFDHERFTYRYAGRDFRLTDVHGRVVREICA